MTARMASDTSIGLASDLSPTTRKRASGSIKRLPCASPSIEALIVSGNPIFGTPNDEFMAGGPPNNPPPSLALTLKLGSLALPDGFIIRGEHGEQAGDSVASAGDVNGDGFDDMVIGAPFGHASGEAYVIFGKPSGFGDIEIEKLDSRPKLGFRIIGDIAGDSAGSSVSSAGDVNGDGFDDLLISGHVADDGGNAAGEVYILFGKSSGFGTIDVTGLEFRPAEGFVVKGDTAGDLAGSSVSTAGDVNGDGFDDIIIGAFYGDDGGTSAGEAYVIFGKASGFATVDLTGLAARPQDGFIIQGDASNDRAGYSVASAGDVNGDGFADMIVGTLFGDDGGYDAGEAYVVYGKAEPFSTVDLTGLADRPGDGFIIQGDSPYDGAGASVASAGDVNGDGLADIIIGARYGDDGGNDAGEAYVIFGKTSERGTIDLTDLASRPEDGFIIQGDTEEDRAGLKVASAGDFNGDGFSDLLVGAPFGNDGGFAAGQAYVVYGKAGGFGTIDLSDLDLRPTEGFVIQGDKPSGIIGNAIAPAGDINDDGYDDLIIGSPDSDDSKIHVIFGFGPETPTIEGASTDDNLIGGMRDEIIRGKQGSDTLLGNGGADTLDGGGSLDWADYRTAEENVIANMQAPSQNIGDALGDRYVSVENLRGSKYADQLFGDVGANRLVGLDGGDILSGRDGKDTLSGGEGRDSLNGGDNADRFDLTSLDADDVDKIVDFAGADTISLQGDVFGLSRGVLNPERFVVGGQAQDANDRLIYKAGQGKLYFDPDGNGAQAQVLIATLTGAPTLGAADFVVI